MTESEVAYEQVMESYERGFSQGLEKGRQEAFEKATKAFCNHCCINSDCPQDCQSYLGFCADLSRN